MSEQANYTAWDILQMGALIEIAPYLVVLNVSIDQEEAGERIDLRRDGRAVASFPADAEGADRALEQLSVYAESRRSYDTTDDNGERG